MVGVAILNCYYYEGCEELVFMSSYLRFNWKDAGACYRPSTPDARPQQKATMAFSSCSHHKVQLDIRWGVQQTFQISKFTHGRSGVTRKMLTFKPACSVVFRPTDKFMVMTVTTKGNFL